MGYSAHLWFPLSTKTPVKPRVSAGAAVTKYCWWGWGRGLNNRNPLLFSVLEAGSPITFQQGQLLVKVLFLAYTQLSCLHMSFF